MLTPVIATSIDLVYLGWILYHQIGLIILYLCNILEILFFNNGSSPISEIQQKKIKRVRHK